jgi:hypothetical protein
MDINLLGEIITLYYCLIQTNYFKFEILTAMNMQSTAFWV